MKKILTISGGVLLIFGLLGTFYSFKLDQKVMGDTNLGVAVFAPSKDSLEWEKKEELRKQSDLLFIVGTLLTVSGIALQTAGSLMK